MTAVEIKIKLQRTLELAEVESLSRLSTVYGIRRMRADGQELLIEFDATRMNEAEVLALVRGAGLPAESAG